MKPSLKFAGRGVSFVMATYCPPAFAGLHSRPKQALQSPKPYPKAATESLAWAKQPRSSHGMDQKRRRAPNANVDPPLCQVVHVWRGGSASFGMKVQGPLPRSHLRRALFQQRQRQKKQKQSQGQARPRQAQEKTQGHKQNQGQGKAR